jgi:hypothetical protein
MQLLVGVKHAQTNCRISVLSIDLKSTRTVLDYTAACGNHPVMPGAAFSSIQGDFPYASRGDEPQPSPHHLTGRSRIERTAFASLNRPTGDVHKSSNRTPAGQPCRQAGGGRGTGVEPSLAGFDLVRPRRCRSIGSAPVGPFGSLSLWRKARGFSFSCGTERDGVGWNWVNIRLLFGCNWVSIRV